MRNIIFLVFTFLTLTFVLAEAKDEDGRIKFKNLRFRRDAYTQHSKFKQFQEFKVKHNKSYENELEEEAHFGNYVRSLDIIDDHNKNGDKHGYMLEENHLSDMSDEDFQKLTGFNPSSGSSKLSRDLVKAYPYNNVTRFLYKYNSSISTPESWDWRSRWNTPVKHQYYCGCCWAFAALGAIEAQLYLNANVSVDLSEQELVDCPTRMNFSTGMSGCSGGDPAWAYAFVATNGVGLESDYWYVSADSGTCNYNNLKKKYFINDFIQMFGQSPETLQQALYVQGPIAVSINFGSVLTKIRSYKNGIWDGTDGAGVECNNQYVHIVLLVGYTNDSWILKNSWGPNWGENGYFRMKKSNTENVCGICDSPSVPRISSNYYKEEK